MNTSNNNLVLSIDKNLIISTIERQLSEAIINGQTDKDTFISKVIAGILNDSVYRGTTYFAYEVEGAIRETVRSTIKAVLDKNSEKLKQIIEKEITKNLDGIAAKLACTIGEDKPIVRVNIELGNFIK